MLHVAPAANNRARLWTWPQPAAYAVALILLASIFLGSPNFRWQSGRAASPFAGDFLQEWIGGYMVRQGSYAHFYDVAYAQQLEHDEQLVGQAWDTSRYFPMVYPPFYYVLVTPLSCLPFWVAAVLWASLMVVAYVGAWQFFLLSTKIKATGAILWLLPASLLFMPLIESFTSCQKGSVLLLILAATYFFLSKKKPYWAGLIFGLIAFKPQFALPIAVAMLCKREWRFVWGGLTSGGVLALLCLTLGVDVCRQYVDFSRHATEYLHNAGYDLTKSHAWYGFFTLLAGGETTSSVRYLTLAANGITVAVAAWSLRGPLVPGSDRFARQFSILIVVTILLSPHLYTYDLTVLLLPLGLLAVQCFRNSTSLPASLKASGLALFCFAGLSPALAGFTGVQITVPLMVVFLLANKKAADMTVDGWTKTSCC